MKMSEHDAIQMLVYAGIGVWALAFGRKTYCQPELMNQRWLWNVLPRRKWLLRMIAAVWVFSGFVALGSSLSCLPPIRAHSGSTWLALELSVSVASTVLLLALTPRDDSKR